MSKNKLITLTLVSIVGVGILLTFIYILANQEDRDDLAVNPNSNSTKVLELEDMVVNSIALEDNPLDSQNDTIQESGSEDIEFGVQGLDGTIYDAFVEYLAPKGYRDSIDVQISLDDTGVVVNANVEYVADNEESRFYQSQFESAYRDVVVGKKIEDIDLSRVGGASLTTAAFMEAVGEIRGKI